MNDKGFSNIYSTAHTKRFKNTLNFLKDLITEQDQILDLGPPNPFSALLQKEGYQVDNTPDGLDLDLDFEMVKDGKYDVVTSFELFEHMVSPFPLLKSVKARKLVASVPLKLWFSAAYWNDDDPFDKHYHEFEPRQFDMLLEKAGWRIIKSEKWKSVAPIRGIRPLLRRFTPRYYIVYCERI